ncbi:MAG: ankyrin repeat domain-containing protein [Actinomycetota bacterium]|nr:ankyrin repeat domain-containing protein [Actinomycetota bacterium]
MSASPEEVLDYIVSGDADGLRELLAGDPSLAEGVDDAGVSLLLQARYRGESELVEIIRAAKPSLDLFEAAALGDVARVGEILDAEPFIVSALAPDGFSALHLAAFFAQPSVAQLLVDRDADVNVEADNSSHVQPLHSAVAGRDVRCVQILLDAGANVDGRQHGGWTALMAASEHGDLEVVRSLLAVGADPSLRSDDGRSSLDFAEAEGHAEVLSALRAAAEGSSS